VPQNLFVLGLSWRTAPVELRERLAFRDDEVEAALSELLRCASVAEAMILSTCNRVEIYGATPRGAPASELTEAAAEARRFLAASRAAPVEALSAALYERTERDAVVHTFRVASSLDSMVVGEAQILGQLKTAFGVAVQAGAAGPVLRRCFECAFSVAKRVRAETGVSRGAANVSSVAVELAGRVFGDLYGKAVAVVGAGKMSDLAARHLRGSGAGSLLVTNRSTEKANEVASRVNGVARPWEDLENVLASADVVISSTGSKVPILNRELMKRVMKKRRHQPQVICDIAVPRDVEPEVGRLDGVYLFDIDDLQKAVAENLKERAKEAEEAMQIVEREAAIFHSRWQSQAVVPTIRALRDHFGAIAKAEAERAVAGLAGKNNPEQVEEMVRRLAELIVAKLLHSPMVALKNNDDETETAALVHAVNRLFSLDDGDESADKTVADKATAQAAQVKQRGRA
jgi:glutamyl-tRNA reductase